MVSVTLLAHEVHYAMGLFVEELRTQQSDWLATFELQQQYVSKLLPPLDPMTPGTTPHLAPVRRRPFAPTSDELAAMCERRRTGSALSISARHCSFDIAT